MADDPPVALTGSPIGAPGDDGRDDGAAGRHGSLRRLAPLIALAALGLMWLAVRGSGVSLPALNGIFADAARTYPVGGVYVDGWVSGRFNPFTDGRLSALTVILCPVWIASVAAVGWPLVRAIPDADRWPSPVAAAAAFLPGYLVVLAPLQIIMSAFPLPTGPRIAFAAVPAAAVLMHRHALGGLLARPRAALVRPANRTLWTAGAVLVGLGLAAVQRLQAGRNFMVPDSGTSLLQWAEAQRIGEGPGRYLAHWDQQADEWVFSAPVMFFRSGARDFLFPLYATQVVALVSFAVLAGALAYTAAWRRRPLAGGVVAAVILAATPAIDPRYSISLWGGQNPAMWLGHPGRLIGIIAPWAILLVLWRGADRRPPVAMIVLATLGLAFVSIHAATYVAVAVAGAVAWRALAGRRPLAAARRASDPVILACGAAGLLAPLAVYAGVVRVDDPDPLGWVLVVAALLAVATAVVIAVGSDGPRPRPAIARLVAPAAGWLAVLGAGLLISGNLTSGLGWAQDAIGIVLPGYGQPVVSRGLLAANPAGSLTFPSFTGQECSISAHCTGGAGYLAGYGMMSAGALAGWLALGGAPAGRRPAMRAMWLACAAALCLSFALVDFTGSAAGVSWIFTRYLEVPFYGLLGLGLVALVASTSAAAVRITVAVAAAWVIVPFAANATPDQWLTNVDYMLRAL